ARCCRRRAVSAHRRADRASTRPPLARHRRRGPDVAPGVSRTIARMHILRLIKIMHVALKYGLDEFLLGHERFRWLRPTVRSLTFWRDLSKPRAERLRLALQDL